MIWLTIALMALIVFSSRYLFLEPKLPFSINKYWLHFLDYTAPAVLTAIWAPIVFVADGQLNLNVESPYLVAAIVATILAMVTKNVLLTTVLSMGLFLYLHIY
ncbi:MAG: AzlD domain-containing protein [Gammaproteobacteria bacterium]|nr:AzlD domain-containing protein [Gammaproteobacteria bacterium]